MVEESSWGWSCVPISVTRGLVGWFSGRLPQPPQPPPDPSPA